MLVCCSIAHLLLVVERPNVIGAESTNAPSTSNLPAEPPVTAADREHWAYRPVQRHRIPPVLDSGWCRTPIDRFILSRLEQAGLASSAEADRPTLLRRVTFDLTGLPPTEAELAAFLSDPSPDAYERVVDRLLAAPSFGERWGQHWLDLARFAETDGFEFDHERPNAWRYRDWVVDALNHDLPFDQFVRSQLAADELFPDDADTLAATGFLLCGPDMPDINLQEERRSNFLNDMTGTVSSTLLALQVGCAQCHDHKYDPISQYDFYRLRAFFDPIDLFKDHPLPGREAPPPSPEIREGLARLDASRAALSAIEESARQKLRTENPDLQPTRDDLLKTLSEEDRDRHKELSQTIATLSKTVKPPDVPRGRIVRSAQQPPQPSRLLIRGDFRNEGPVVAPAFPRIAMTAAMQQASSQTGAGVPRSRAELADWLTSPEHPLTARVFVNRVWQHHFGRGLVETASDFGRMGADPTHPELLDWLAAEFVASEWRMKELHRLLVTSAVYRQACKPPSANDNSLAAARATEKWSLGRRADPENRLLWHMPRQRLEGEAIRDAMLSAAGWLNPERRGPGVRPPLPSELVATLLKNQWNESPSAADHVRRSLYLFVRRNLRYPLFEAFDRPDTNASCARRNRSTIAPQALVLLNSEFSLAVARELAGLLLERGETPVEQARIAYRRTLGREPTTAELLKGTTFLSVQAENLRRTRRPVGELALPGRVAPSTDPYAAAALCDFCLTLFNLNEFVYVD